MAVKQKDSTKKVFISAALLYSAWVGFFLVCSFLRLPIFQQEQSAVFAVSIVFILSCLFCTLIAAGRIHDLKYIPSIIIPVFIVSGRLISFIGAVVFTRITGKTLFLLPFGSIDFFLFYFLYFGFLNYIRKEEEKYKKPQFKLYFLLPLLLFACPVFVHFFKEGFTGATVYSLVYTSVAVTAMISGLSFRRALPKQKLTALPMIVAVPVDMLIYLEFTQLKSLLPPMLNYLLLPYALFLFSYTVSKPQKEN